MKSFLIVCGALVLILATHAAFAVGNEITNGDFENFLNGWIVDPADSVHYV